MKTTGIIPFVGLVLVVTVSNAAPINIDSRWRGLAASAGGAGTTNFSTTAPGPLQATFQDRAVCGCLPFPGYGFNLAAGASQDTQVGFISNGVFSIAGRGDVHALTTLTVANEYGAVAAQSALDVQFTIDQPLSYSVTANLFYPAGQAYVYLLRQNGTNGRPVFAFGRPYFNNAALNTGGASGVLSAGSYRFVAGVEGGGYAQSGDGYFATTFTVTPPPPPAPSPSPVLTRLPAGLALSWPVSATNLVLETAPSLTMPASWTTSTNAVQQSNGMFSVTINPVAPSQFFRLRTL